MGKLGPRGAAVGATVALVYLLARYVAPVWGVPILCVVAGLISAGLFVRLYVREPPSLERFRWLSAYGVACIAGLVPGVTMAGARLLGDGHLSVRISIGSLIVGWAGLFVFVVWHWLAVQKYSRKQSDPDFEEDAEGNPVRRPEPDVGEPRGH
jgi:hypothetical protein